MAKITEDVTEDLEINEVDEISPEDFIFIIKADGTLKSVMFPDDEIFEYSERIMDVFRVFDIDDPNELTAYTIH